MGGTNSKTERKLTVENENAIQVSQDVLNRIQDQLVNRSVATSSTDITPPREPVQPSSYVDEPPQFLPTDLYLAEKRNREYAAEEAYWAQRIENLKRQHQRINASMDIEYQKTLKETNELYEQAIKSATYSIKIPPCQEEKAKVLQCYDSNPNKSLLCSVVVNQFNDCVCRSRVAAVSASS